MTEIRLKGPAAGTNLGTVSVTVGEETATATVPDFHLPAIASGLPRLSSGQFATDTFALDTSGLTGVTAYDWREVGGATIGTAATQSGMGHGDKWIECEVTCDQGTLVSPPFLVYMGMGMAGHDADDAAMLALVPHDEATHIAVADGAFTSAGTWLGGTVPRNGARVLIPNGVEVTYDRHKYYRLDWIRIDGTLKASLTKSTYCLAEHYIITRGGRLEVGTGAARLPSQYKSEWVISNRNCRIENRFPTDLDIANDPQLMGRCMMSQGERVMWGAAKTSWLRTAAGSAPMAGDTSLTLAAAPSGWAVGDTIMIGETGAVFSSTVVYDFYETEYRTITAINGAVVSWADPLLYDHDHQNANVTRTDLQPGIANLTRNIVIRSESDSVPAHQRGHTMDMHMNAHQDLWDVEHYALGRTMKGTDTPVGELLNDNTEFRYWSQPTDTDDTGGEWITETPTARSNIKSRYPIHAHFLGFGKVRRDVVNGCTVRDTPGWSIVHHGCENFLNGNVMTDFAGSGMVSETGNETGEWLGNFSSGSRARTSSTPKNMEFRKGIRGDFGRYGVGFYMRSRAIRCNSNFSMGASAGFVFYHRTDSGNTITPPIDHLVENTFVKDLQGFQNDGTRSMADEPIVHANDNESAGMSGDGMFVTKPFGEQNHGLNINIKRLKTWGFLQSGIHVEYINQYALTDIDAVASGIGGVRYGVNLGANIAQVSVVRAVTEGCLEGIHINGTAAVPDNTGFDATNNPRYMVVAHSSTNDTQAVTTGYDSASFLKTYVTEPAYIEPSHNVPFKIGEWDGAAGFNLGITATYGTPTLTDTVSAAGLLPKPGDNLGFPISSPASTNQGFDMSKFVTLNGYWMVDGVPYAIFPMYFSDRLTGDWIKTFHGMELTGSLVGLTNNGAYTLSANAPTVSAASLSVSEGGTASIDLLALASDVDGGTLTLSDSYFAPDHGRVTFNGGVVTYTHDDTGLSADKMQFAIEDGQGNATRVDVPITVTG